MGYVEVGSETRVPVGYIFHWCPVSGSDVDLSTPQKVRNYWGYGTWKEITGRFLYGHDNTSTPGITGGSTSVTLTKENLPKINFNLGMNAGGYVGPNSAPQSFIRNGGSYGVEQKTGDTTDRAPEVYASSKLIQPIGGGKAHSNMPPYIAVYIWQRIA